MLVRLLHHFLISLLFPSFYSLSAIGAGNFNSPTSGEEIILNKLNPKCVPINIELCGDMLYNMTIYPNILNHTKQEEAAEDLKEYEALIKFTCSPDIKLFLCTLFTPVCTMLSDPIQPCKQLCLSAKKDCSGVMQRFGYGWPVNFNCDQFPESGLCVNRNQTETEGDLPEEPSFDSGSKFECPHTMRLYDQEKTSRHILKIANSTIQNCSLPCHADTVLPIFFDISGRNYLRLWIGLLAVSCCICTLFAIITFLIDLERFEFPEKAILYMAVCYLVVSITYMIGLVAEDKLSCSTLSATKAQLVTQGYGDLSCIALGAAHYLFTMAGMMWWLIMCFSWFLVTTLKWGEAPVGQVFTKYFNLLAWALPGIGVTLIISTESIDGDIFTGICSIGNLRSWALLNFVVFPQAVIITLGLFFFFCGFISILQIRSYINRQRFITKMEKDEALKKIGRLMCRISCFSLIYVIPTIVGIACTFFYSQYIDRWMTSWYSTRCLHAQRGTFGFSNPRQNCPPLSDETFTETAPRIELFFLKYLSYFMIGIACVGWTLNRKTVITYRDFMVRMAHGRSAVPTD